MAGDNVRGKRKEKKRRSLLFGMVCMLLYAIFNHDTHNGHIGFNEPADEFPKETHCVDLSESTIEANARFFASRDEVPKQAYTMGIGSIMKAKTILIMACGRDKKEIVKRAFEGPICPQVPASVLQLHNNVILVGDKACLN